MWSKAEVGSAKAKGGKLVNSVDAAARCPLLMVLVLGSEEGRDEPPAGAAYPGRSPWPGCRLRAGTFLVEG